MLVLRKILPLLKKPLLILLLLAAIFLFLKQMKWLPNFGNWFGQNELTLQHSPLVIESIKQIAQLQAAQMYAEVVVDSTGLTNMGVANKTLRSIGILTIPIKENRAIVLIVKGKVVAGVDLKQLKAEDFFTEKDSIRLRLPKASFLEIITNPADFETFLEEGDWKPAEITAIKNKARKQLIALAYDQKLLEKATAQTHAALTSFLKVSGFKRIEIQTK